MKSEGTSSRGRRRRSARPAFTLVELLVVITIITILVAIMIPAVNAARENARATTCASNLRQFGVAMFAHSQRHGTFCSGAFDWKRDGCPTEVGWVADMVAAGVPVGKMNCPTNQNTLSETLNQLAMMTPAEGDPCINLLGSPPETAPDASKIANPCRLILDPNLDGNMGDALAPGNLIRVGVVNAEVYNKHYNTNFTASWWLVRSGTALDGSGNLRKADYQCVNPPVVAGSLLTRASTQGPLAIGRLDASGVSSSFVPLLGDGAAAGPLAGPLAQASGTMFAVRASTRGPVLTQPVTYGGVTTPILEAPVFPAGTPREGGLGIGWWAGWKLTLQDYRGFAPVHRNTCNILFADGSVRGIADLNRDGLLNNGFTGPAALAAGFADDQVELPPEEFVSGWSLSGK